MLTNIPQLHARVKMLERERNKRILVLRKQGWTMQKIADKFGITKARVSQIIQKYAERGETI